MPLRATSDQGEIHAFEFDDGSWADLKASYRDRRLRMPCCGVAAVPKTSTRGNFFFAHARRGECTTADESAEHLYCKTLVARAAQAAGWTVTTERPGQAPGGEQWVADIFCEKGSAKIALEIQMSPQTDAQTRQRQALYRESGVRGAWFFGASSRKRGEVPVERETPVFALQAFHVGEVPMVLGFDVGLPEFVTALLSRRVSWTIPRYQRPHLVEYLVDTCWACKREVKQVLEHLRGGDSPSDRELAPEDFYEGRWDPSPNTVANISQRLEAVCRDISNNELAASGLNLIGRKDVINGKPTRFPYCNMCVHCGAFQNNHHLTQRVLAGRRLEYGQGEGGQHEERTSPFGVMTVAREIKGQPGWKMQGPEADQG